MSLTDRPERLDAKDLVAERYGPVVVELDGAHCRNCGQPICTTRQGCRPCESARWVHVYTGRCYKAEPRRSA